MTRDRPTDVDELLERLDRGDPPASPEEEQARAPYVRMHEKLRTLPPATPDAGWERRLDARLRAAERRRRVAAVLIGAGTLAAAAVAFLLVRRGPDIPAATRVSIVGRDGRRATSPTVDARITIATPRKAREAELRIYRDTQLIIQCPGITGASNPPSGDVCKVHDHSIELTFVPPTDGAYSIVIVRSDRAIPAAGPLGLDRDVLEAQRAGANVESQALSVTR